MLHSKKEYDMAFVGFGANEGVKLKSAIVFSASVFAFCNEKT